VLILPRSREFVGVRTLASRTGDDQGYQDALNLPRPNFRMKANDAARIGALKNVAGNAAVDGTTR